MKYVYAKIANCKECPFNDRYISRCRHPVNEIHFRNNKSACVDWREMAKCKKGKLDFPSNCPLTDCKEIE